MQNTLKALEYAMIAAIVSAVGTGLYVTGLGVYMVKAFGILLGHVIG